MTNPENSASRGIEGGVRQPRANPWLIAIAVMLATILEVLDTSVANVALPHIAGNLSTTRDEATWVLTSYLVSNAIVLPMTGWLSIHFGRKRFLMFCVAFFLPCLCGVRSSTHPWDTDSGPDFPRRGRGGASADFPDHSYGELPSSQARSRHGHLRHGRCSGPDHRTDPRRLDHG